MQNNQFSRNLNYLMEQHGITNYRLAKAFGVHATTIANWRNGVSSPNKGKLIFLADVFKISVDQLTGSELPPVIKNENSVVKFDVRQIVTRDALSLGPEDDKTDVDKELEGLIRILTQDEKRFLLASAKNVISLRK